MRIFTPITVSVGVLLCLSPDIRAGESPAA
jgi:hypothetical protein